MVKVDEVFHTYSRFPVVVRLLIIVLLMTLTVGVIIHFIEPNTFPTIFDGIWWAIVTATTVGYGDFVPQSFFGRLVGVVLILFGIGFVTFFLTTLASSTITTKNSLKQGELAFKKGNHTIVVGWNERAKNTIIHLHQLHPDLQIVLIDESVQERPIDIKNVHFIRGNPTEDVTLQRANVRQAKTVLITADQRKSETEADTKSIIVLLAIKGLNPLIYSIVELLTPEQLKNCRRAGADEILQSAYISSLLMVNSTLFNGVATVFSDLLDHQEGNKMIYIHSPEELTHESFERVCQHYLNHQTLVLGIKRGEQLLLNPTPSLQLEEEDKLIVIQR
ncbi:potassium channel family protein [Anaerobacillus sp. MEB173]|uniref:potassium channel family protein n=1 Tax=Anaerobacillus sp. MEB173 TaxID=3383345 RepID=UPI003F93F6A0